MDNNYVSFWGNENNLGKLISVTKAFRYAGKDSNNRAIYHVCYEALFYNPDEKVLGKITDKQEFTAQLTTKSKSMMKKVLKQKGFIMEEYMI